MYNTDILQVATKTLNQQQASGTFLIWKFSAVSSVARLIYPSSFVRGFTPTAESGATPKAWKLRLKT